MFEIPSDDARLAALFSEERLMALGPGRPNPEARRLLEQLDLATAFGSKPIADRSMAQCCLAGIWLYHDFLDESHRISQDIATPSGSYWHGILHRREPDSWNSKYWFDRVGKHPIFPKLRQMARDQALAEDERPEARFLIEQKQWDPGAFIDLCEASRLGRAPTEMLCRKIQLREWQLLFDYCFRRALGE